MLKLTMFSRLVVEVVDNGYIVEIEGENEDERFVFTSPRQVIRFLKEKLNATGDE